VLSLRITQGQPDWFKGGIVLKKKRIIALRMVLAMGLMVMTGCGGSDSSGDAAGGDAAKLSGKDISKDEIKVAMIPISTAGYTNVLGENASKDIQTGYPNLVVDFFDAEYDATTQTTLIKEAIAQKYDAIVLEAADPVAVSPAVTEAEEAGVVVITMNMGADAVHTLHLESDSYSAGWIAGETIANKLGNKGDVILLDVPAPLKASAHHGTGFEEYIEQNPGLNIIDTQNVDGFSQEEANKITTDLLTKYDKIDAIFAVADDEAMGVLQAVKAAGRDKEGILIFGAEGLPSALDATKAGEIYGTAWNDRYNATKTVLDMALYFIASGVNGTELGYAATPAIKQPFYAVTAENVDAIMTQSHWPDYDK
jgi:ABC-type sugar transport system substrate-binding protein